MAFAQKVQCLQRSRWTREDILQFLKDHRFATAKLLNYRDMKPLSYFIEDPSGQLAALCLVSQSVLFELPFEKPQIYIEYLVVREDFQRQGLGTCLMNHVMQRWPRRKIYLHCFKDHLVEYYQRFGFKVKDQKDISDYLLERLPCITGPSS